VSTMLKPVKMWAVVSGDGEVIDDGQQQCKVFTAPEKAYANRIGEYEETVQPVVVVDAAQWEALMRQKGTRGWCGLWMRQT